MRVNYRDMGTEELGSVYESLLELQPVVDVNATPWAFSFLGDGNGEKVKGSARKLSGSYYTPPSLVNELIKSALEPVLAQAVADSSRKSKESHFGSQCHRPGLRLWTFSAGRGAPHGRRNRPYRVG